MPDTPAPMLTPQGHVPVALVTGGSSGIGLAAARRLAERGFRVGIVGRTSQKLANAMATLHTITGMQGNEPGGTRFAALRADLAEPGASETLFRSALDTFGRIDAIVLSAGDAPLASIDTTDDAMLQRTFAVNTYAPAATIRAAWPTFISQGGGCIVGVSSMASADPFEGFFAYAAAKAALNSFIRSAVKEGEQHGIRAFAVAPAAVETPMLRALFSESDIPKSACLAPDDVGRLIADCIAGVRPDDNGRTIFISRAEAGVQIKVSE